MKKTKSPFILASNSPRRSILLNQIKLEFTVTPARIREEILKSERPADYVKRIALKKGEKVASEYPDRTVIAADTIVVLQDKILGKPKSQKMAKEMLRELRGKEHKVITGVSVINKSKNKALCRSIETRVTMKPFSNEEIDSYVKTKEPLDKAGGYGIQEKGAVLVDSIKGSYTNVVGLPLEALWEMLKETGLEPWQMK